jgi:hypothetical protein
MIHLSTPRPRTGKLVMGILALIAEFENDIRFRWTASLGPRTEA